MSSGEKVLVGRLPFDITEDELRQVFSTYGDVTDVQLTGPGAASVVYARSESAEDSVTVLHEVYRIRVDAESPITVRWPREENRRGRNELAASSKPVDSAGYDRGEPATAEKQGVGYKLFVGGLPDDITEDQLRQVFTTYGSVNHAVIMKPNSSTGLRAAFIFYDSKDSAEDAITVLDRKYRIRVDAPAEISVRWAQAAGQHGSVPERSEPGYKLFVGSLPEDIREEEVRLVFQTYGQVNLVHIMTPNNQSGNRAALVFYENRESGEDAILLLHDKYKIREDADHPIRVKWGKDGDSSGKSDRGKGKGRDEWGDEWGQGGNGSKDVKNSWQAGGDKWNGWSDNAWNGSNGWSDSWSSSGGWQDNGWNNASWNDSGWSRGGKGKSWQNDSWGRDDKGKGWDDKGKGKGWDDKGKGKGKDDKGKGKGRHDDNETPEPSSKLYVANLPEDITENALEYVFNNYGKVQKVHIMTGKVVKGAISAFIEYGNEADAETAINSLRDNYEIRQGFGPILVKYAQTRRSQPY